VNVGVDLLLYLLAAGFEPGEEGAIAD